MAMFIQIFRVESTIMSRPKTAGERKRNWKVDSYRKLMFVMRNLRKGIRKYDSFIWSFKQCNLKELQPA